MVHKARVLSAVGLHRWQLVALEAAVCNAAAITGNPGQTSPGVADGWAHGYGLDVCGAQLGGRQVVWAYTRATDTKIPVIEAAEHGQVTSSSCESLHVLHGAVSGAQLACLATVPSCTQLQHHPSGGWYLPGPQLSATVRFHP